MTNKRGTPRRKKRLSCSLNIDGQRYPGLLLDLSATGLFVQTSASPNPGSELEVELILPGGEALPLRASVARRRSVPARLKSIDRSGVGLRLAYAPEEYLRLIEELQDPREQVSSVRPAAKHEEAPESDLAHRGRLARLKRLRSESS